MAKEKATLVVAEFAGLRFVLSDYPKPAPNVIDYWLQLPLAIRFATIATAGVVLGAVANWAIYTLCYFPRAISPWSPPTPEAPRRLWWDRIPVIGWIGLRRETFIHGRWFWIRPMLIELAFPSALVWYYAYVTLDMQLFDLQAGLLFRVKSEIELSSIAWMNQLYWPHALALCLMVAATFIDFDEQTVPDWITIPGTFIALSFASLSANVWLPYTLYHADGSLSLYPTMYSAPNSLSESWNSTSGLLTGLAIFTGWCFALADRRVILRRGIKKAITYFVARLFRHWTWKLLAIIWIVGCLAVIAVFRWGGEHWNSLLTSLIGLAVGGGAVWSVRLVAGSAMRQEAMGFGDVTLMAMLGAFVGWQAALMAFAIAPMTAVFIVLIQFILTRNRVVAFGPYLCAGTIVTVLFWPTLWNEFGAPAFALGAILPFILISLLLVMGVMLTAWRWVKHAAFGIE